MPLQRPRSTGAHRDPLGINGVGYRQNLGALTAVVEPLRTEDQLPERGGEADQLILRRLGLAAEDQHEVIGEGAPDFSSFVRFEGSTRVETAHHRAQWSVEGLDLEVTHRG